MAEDIHATSGHATPPRRARPLSPHLSIYKWQISSTLSILHRMTGVGLFVGALLLVWWIVISVYSSFNVNLKLWSLLTALPGRILLFLWTFALFYHLLNGIRHLFWDAGKGFDVRVMTRTGWAVVTGSVLLTLVTWALALYK